jgi:hypothetical protein
MERPDGSLHDEDFDEEALSTDEPETGAVPDPDEREVGLAPEEEELEPIPDDPVDADA